MLANIKEFIQFLLFSEVAIVIPAKVGIQGICSWVGAFAFWLLSGFLPAQE
jgi:hypothetical protein